MDFSPQYYDTWVKLPLELLRRNGMTKGAAVLLAVIIDQCRHAADMTRPITAQELTARTGTSRMTLQRHLNELRSLGLIQTKRTGRENLYTITPGCVELCGKVFVVKEEEPDPRADQSAQGKQTSRRRPRKGSYYSKYIEPMTAAERREMEEYTAFVNNFENGDKLENQPSLIDSEGGSS